MESFIVTLDEKAPYILFLKRQNGHSTSEYLFFPFPFSLWYSISSSILVLQRLQNFFLISGSVLKTFLFAIFFISLAYSLYREGSFTISIAYCKKCILSKYSAFCTPPIEDCEVEGSYLRTINSDWSEEDFMFNFNDKDIINKSIIKLKHWLLFFWTVPASDYFITWESLDQVSISLS